MAGIAILLSIGILSETNFTQAKSKKGKKEILHVQVRTNKDIFDVKSFKKGQYGTTQRLIDFIKHWFSREARRQARKVTSNPKMLRASYWGVKIDLTIYISKDEFKIDRQGKKLTPRQRYHRIRARVMASLNAVRNYMKRFATNSTGGSIITVVTGKGTKHPQIRRGFRIKVTFTPRAVCFPKKKKHSPGAKDT